MNPGDAVLVESPVYAQVHITQASPKLTENKNLSGVIPMFQSLHCELIGERAFVHYAGEEEEPSPYYLPHGQLTYIVS